MAYLPSPYQTNWGMMQQPQTQGLIWVDGEVGAKAYQLPPGWPVNTPLALWDTNDTVIYLKSTNQMGMPNPLQKARYQLEDRKSGAAGREDYTEQTWDEEKLNKFASKDEVRQLREEIEKLKRGGEKE